MDSKATATADPETIDELAHYVRLGREDFHAEARRGTYTDDELAEAERRWRNVQHLLLTLEVEARAFPTNKHGYVLCHRIARRGTDAGMADREQFPTREQAETAMGERYSQAQQRLERLHVVRTYYVTPDGNPLKRGGLAPDSH